MNKIDLVGKAGLLPLMEQAQKWHDFAAIVPVSAATGDGVERLEQVLLEQLPEQEPIYPEDFLTDQPERTLVAEIVREKVLHHTRNELPFSTAVVVDQFDESDGARARPRHSLRAGMLRLYCTIYVETESQKPIIIGRGGSMIKQIGTEARMEIEEFFETKVYLDLRVKVDPDWRNNDRTLDEIGVPRTVRKPAKPSGPGAGQARPSTDVRARMITTRFAPAPTGHLHLGHVVNALYVWETARREGGRVLLRIEDHDRQRSRPEYEASILEDLAWLGSSADAPLVRQSERTTIYKAALSRLRDADSSTPANARAGKSPTPADPAPSCVTRAPALERTCRTPGARAPRPPPALARKRSTTCARPAGQVPADQCGDLLLRDRHGNWTYQFAVTVDDIEQGVDLVIRGSRPPGSRPAARSGSRACSAAPPRRASCTIRWS